MKLEFTNKESAMMLYYNDAVSIIYEACTACYDNTKDLSYEEKKEYIAKRVKHGHGSVLEHGYLSMMLVNRPTSQYPELADIFAGTQYLRHYMTVNEDNTFNLLIGGSIRGFIDLVAKVENLDGEIFTDIMSLLYDHTVKEFYCGIEHTGRIDMNRFVDVILSPEDDCKDVNETQNLIETPQIKVYGYPSKEYKNEMFIFAFKYGFTLTELLTTLPITVLFKNMSRTATHQLVRHRNGITQESQRYVNYAGNDFYVPDSIKDKTINIKIFGKEVNMTPDKLAAELMSIYPQLRESGFKKEDARAFLPSNVLCKRIYMTFSLDSLISFLALRTDAHAQEEIRKYALHLEAVHDSIYYTEGNNGSN